MTVAVCEEAYSKEGYKLYEEDMLENTDEDDQSSDSGDSQSFEHIAKKMVDVTPDGGVKKQTLVHGIGEVVPPDANVMSNLILFIL